MSDQLTTRVVEAVKDATPPVAVSGMHFFGVSLPDVVSILTIVYLLVHAGYIIYKWKKGI